MANRASTGPKLPYMSKKNKSAGASSTLKIADPPAPPLRHLRRCTWTVRRRCSPTEQFDWERSPPSHHQGSGALATVNKQIAASRLPRFRQAPSHVWKEKSNWGGKRKKPQRYIERLYISWKASQDFFSAFPVRKLRSPFCRKKEPSLDVKQEKSEGSMAALCEISKTRRK